MKLYACIKPSPFANGRGNGYVLIPKEHPLFGIDYGDKRMRNIEVHGGITWSENELPEAKLVTWSTETPENLIDFWVLGFDTAHYYSHKGMNKEWVKQETLRLLKQLQSIK